MAKNKFILQDEEIFWVSSRMKMWTVWIIDQTASSLQSSLDLQPSTKTSCVTVWKEISAWSKSGGINVLEHQKNTHRKSMGMKYYWSLTVDRAAFNYNAQRLS